MIPSIIHDHRDRFFFSSRRRHTRFDCDWSSDVCSSDLEGMVHHDHLLRIGAIHVSKHAARKHRHLQGDRKSTRLNSSHSQISYAVFCLKKKKNKYLQSIHHTTLHSTHTRRTAHAIHPAA